MDMLPSAFARSPTLSLLHGEAVVEGGAVDPVFHPCREAHMGSISAHEVGGATTFCGESEGKPADDGRRIGSSASQAESKAAEDVGRRAGLGSSMAAMKFLHPSPTWSKAGCWKLTRSVVHLRRVLEMSSPTKGCLLLSMK